MSKRQTRDARVADAVALGPGVRIANAWLITGHDTMHSALRGTLRELLSYWRLVRAGLHTAARGKWRDLDRNAWLELDYAERRLISMKVWYAPEKIQRIAYRDHPFLALLPKFKRFSAGAGDLANEQS